MDKIKSRQVALMYSLIFCSLYLGTIDIVILNESKQNVFISMILGNIIGIIPILLYLKINDYNTNLNIYQKNKYLFKKKLGNILNIIIILINFLLLSVVVRKTIVFLTSKYLYNTSFLFVGLLLSFVNIVICLKSIGTIIILNEIVFFIILVLTFIIQFSLLKFVDLNNIFPLFIKTSFFKSTIKPSIYYASCSSLLIFTLLTINKDKIKDKKNYNKSIIISYIVSSILLLIVMFFVISCLGYKMAYIFRYPEYILLKKISINNSELHLENILGIRWLLYKFSLCNICLYNILKGIKNIFKITSSKIIIIISIIISMFSILIAYYFFGNTVTKVIINSEKYYLFFITIPIMLILIIVLVKSKIKNQIKNKV